MLTNYHTHTKRCRHANGEDREYIENAIKAGIKILGFSDHAPYLFDETWYYSHYRMYIDQIEEYTSSINALKREYQSDIQIYLGFELEYYKTTHQKEIEFLRKYNPEYLVLGQHFVGGETTGCYVSCQSDDSVLTQYVSECIEALKTGHFTYIAHPDIIGYDYSDEAITAVSANGGHLAAICAAPLVLGRRGLLEGKRATCFPGFESELRGAEIVNADFVTDGNVTTGRGMEYSLPFAKELVRVALENK